MAMRSFSLRD